jgi:hypothetical protein
MSESQSWYYARQGQRQGPMPIETLKQVIAQGQVSPADLVWKAGLPAWAPAHTFPDLMPLGVTPSLGYYTAPPPSADDIGQNAGVRLLLPVGRSGWAIAAGYLGLFSVLLLPAPIALGISIMAIRDIRTHPDRHGMGRAIFGLIMGGLGTIPCLFLLASLFMHHR